MRPNVTTLMQQMTLEEKIGQLLMARVLEGPDGMPSNETERLIKEYYIGSVLFYSTKDPEFTARYTNQLQKWAAQTRLRIPLLVGADFEFGPRMIVSEGVTGFPQEMGIGATGDLKMAALVAQITAQEARAMGVQWVFAPVADVNTNPKNPVIGVRSFGSNPQSVSEMVMAEVEAYKSNNVIGTVKHFPGHGDTALDSHYSLPSVEYGLEGLNKHLQPFKAAIAAGADSIMTAHIIVKALDPKRPATLSRALLTDLLRGELGFKGLIVTDAMNMRAISDHFGAGEAAVMAIKAGADVVMSAGSYWDLIAMQSALLQAVRDGEISESRIDESVERVLELKVRYGLFEDRYVDPGKAKEVCGTPEHLQIALDIARHSITLLKNDNRWLPLPSDLEKILIVGVRDTVYAVADEIQRRFPKMRIENYRASHARPNNNWAPSASDIAVATAIAKEVDTVIVLTYSSQEVSDGQVELIKTLSALNKPLVVVAEGLPYDIMKFPDISTYLVNYGYNRWGAPSPVHDAVTRATVDVLFGEFKPTGKLPVEIPGLFPLGYGISY